MIKNCDKVKYLGVIINKNFKFNSHIEHTLKKANIAKSELHNFLTNNLINNKVKTLAYKQIIRPIFLYASACWQSISSNQMEKIRRHERWFLRRCTGLYRNNNNGKYINSQILYEKSNTNRIDRKIVEHNIKYIEKLKNHTSENIRNMTRYNDEYINRNKYKPINYIYSLNEKNILYTENKLLLYNKKRNAPHQLVYVTNQNTENVICK